MFDEFFSDRLVRAGRTRPQAGDTVGDVGYEVKPVQIINVNSGNASAQGAAASVSSVGTTPRAGQTWNR